MLADAAGIVCGAGRVYVTVERPSLCPSVRPAVCSINRHQQRRPAGLVLSTLRAGDIDRQLRSLSSNGAAARRSPANADSVNQSINHAF